MPGFFDIHSHHYPDVYLDACRRPDSGLEHYTRDDGRLVVLQDGAVVLATPQPLPSLEQRLQDLNESELSFQVLSVSAPNVYRFPSSLRAGVTREANDELVSLASQSNGHMGVFASLPLPDVKAALAELDRVHGLAEVCGVILCTNIAGTPLDDPSFEPLLSELSRREITVFVHPTAGYCQHGLDEYALSLGFGFMAETTVAIARLVFSGVLERHQGINWVFSHLGGYIPFVVHRFGIYYNQFPECRDLIKATPRELLDTIYFDTASTHVPALRCAFDTFSPGQFLFGTDYPHVPGGMTQFVEALGTLNLDKDDAEAVAWKTATRLMSITNPDGE